MSAYLHGVVLGLLALLPVANPLTSLTLLITLGHGLGDHERNRQIRRAALYVVAIILVCFYGGHWIMTAFGISIPGLRIAGGLIVAYIGFGMLFPNSESESDAQHAMLSEKEKEHPHTRDLSFVPLALPGTAGPGTIALVISAAASLHDKGGIALSTHLAVVTTAVLVGLIFWLALRSAHAIMRVLGASGIDAISRVLGFLLVGMGVQFAINGMVAVAHSLGA